ncbi:hypothetical protein E2C01_087222 [Portunus trituberculatus]|uniref:Uncharacterized protein n=1 Tax=Portunus trituberculatus TaxID=210409 RepID=A0A5B7J618_PORTR|nr:hypothetical protein [Portunus trituberculatus]
MQPSNSGEWWRAVELHYAALSRAKQQSFSSDKSRTLAPPLSRATTPQRTDCSAEVQIATHHIQYFDDEQGTHLSHLPQYQRKE